MVGPSNLNNIFQSTAARAAPQRRSAVASEPRRPRPTRSTFLAFPGDGEGLFRGRDAYSAALATAAFSFSSKASMRRAVAWGDFVKRARRL